MDQSLNKNYFKVANGVWGMKIIFVNVYMIAENDHWVLIDAGLPGTAKRIINMANDIFGAQPPAAIIFTHGHFDHRGAIDQLLEVWDVPVYAHPMELPYLTGKSAYPPPDPNAGGGLMTLLSIMYPRRPIDLGNKILQLIENGKLPYLPNWSYIHTPGHAPGHISLFRDTDKVLIAGDAFVTTRQESAIAAFTYPKIISGPPRYFTPDWLAAKQSVLKLRNLHPAIAATGHGEVMQGEELKNGLDHLVKNFTEISVPKYGRYTNEAAVANQNGVQYVPPARTSPGMVLSVVALTGVIALGVYKVLNEYKRLSTGFS